MDDVLEWQCAKHLLNEMLMFEEIKPFHFSTHLFQFLTQSVTNAFYPKKLAVTEQLKMGLLKLILQQIALSSNAFNSEFSIMVKLGTLQTMVLIQVLRGYGEGTRYG